MYMYDNFQKRQTSKKKLLEDMCIVHSNVFSFTLLYILHKVKSSLFFILSFFKLLTHFTNRNVNNVDPFHETKKVCRAERQCDSIFFTFNYSQPGPSLIYLYSIHRAICRHSDHSVGRPRAEIRTRDGRI